MAQEPVKPINEIERKTWVSDQDLILILDSSTGEARLADKEELRGVWIQDIAKSKSGRTTTITFHTTDKKSYQIKLEDGDDWLTPQFALEQTVFKRKFPNEEVWKTLFDIENFRGEKGEDGKNPEFKFSGTHIQRRLQGERGWKNLLPIDELKGKAFTYEDFTSEQLEALRGGKGDKGDPFKFEDLTPEQLKKLKGDQWDKGDQGRQWDKGDPWESPEFRKTNDYLQIKLPSERTWKNLIPLADITWPAGSGSGDMLKSENLYWLTNKEQARSNLDVYSKAEVSAELNKKSNTAHNHDSAYYKKTEVDGKLGKKADLINGLVPSSQLPSYVDDVLEYNTRAQFPTTGEKGKIYIAINDDSQWRWTGTTYKKMVSSPWSTDAIPEGSQNLYFTPERAKGAVQSELNGKADLVGGKVPASQLPEVSQIDESNLVHKSWDEVIRWNKTFKDAPSLATDIGWDTNIVLRKFHDVRWSKIRILFRRWSWTSENPRPANVWDVMGAINFEDAVEWNSYFGIEVRKWQGKGKAIISESDLHIWWKRPIDIHVNDQNRTGERQDYTPTLSGSWGGTPAKYWSQRWRYKIIWKMCFWWAKVEFQKWTLSGRPYISLPNKSKWEWESIGAESLVWWTGTTLKNTYWYASINDGKIEILHWFGQAGDWSAIQSWDTAISVKFFYEIE